MSEVPGSLSKIKVWIFEYPSSRPTRAAAAYNFEQAFLLPSVQSLVTSRTDRASVIRATGRPTQQTPTKTP
jgi:hypothetical protein